MIPAVRVALVAGYPPMERAGSPLSFPNLGVRRVQAILEDAAETDGIEVRVFEVHDEPAELLADRILGWGPTVVGASAFMWSLPVLHRAAKQLVRRDPHLQVVYGGPSAHPNSFQRPPFDDASSFVTALMGTHGGGYRMLDLVRALRRGTPPSEVPGIWVPTRAGWQHTGVPPAPPSLVDTPSPYQRGLVETGNAALLQTYVGCPYSCQFCSWGVQADPDDVLSREALVAELAAFRRRGLLGALQVDAGLNLNERAFRNLVDAEREVGFFREAALIVEVYARDLHEPHLQFLSGIARPRVSVGLQSYDPGVLANLHRPFDPAWFERAVRSLAEVAGVNIEIMVGLPGDNPESFWRTFEKVRELPADFRVYHCCVLPDALAARAPARYAMDWDPVTLKMRSCWGWSEHDLRATLDRLTELAEEEGSNYGEYWWNFQCVARRPLSRTGAKGDTTDVG